MPGPTFTPRLPFLATGANVKTAKDKWQWRIDEQDTNRCSERRRPNQRGSLRAAHQEEGDASRVGDSKKAIACPIRLTELKAQARHERQTRDPCVDAKTGRVRES